MAVNPGYVEQQQGGYGQPPVVQQPAQAHHTTVVVNQQVAQQRTIKSWSSGIFGCFDDCGICLCVLFCEPCASCKLAQDLGEFACLYCCVPNWLTPVRTKVRTHLGIQGSICDDCCMSTFCGVCTLCQVMREVKLAKQNGEM